MRIGIYDPYLQTLGGGEWYVLSIAACLSQEHDVRIFWDNVDILASAQERFGLNTKGISLKPNVFSTGSFFQRKKATEELDVMIFVSDGSIPWLFAKKNILLFQFPVNWVRSNIITKLKLSRIKTIICYSDFVKQFIDKSFHTKSIVLPPSLAVEGKFYKKKENIILTVGRFTKAMNAKKQEVLIQTFKKMIDHGLSGWKLVIAGGVLSEDQDFVDSLKNDAQGYPIIILPNISHEKLQELYAKAKIYWHAAGFGEDLEKYPERAEHFGITTVEAMSSSVVPIVINAGGQKEIVQEGNTGFLWKDLSELEEKTKEVMTNKKLWETISKNAQERSKDFSSEEFCIKVHKYLL